MTVLWANGVATCISHKQLLVIIIQSFQIVKRGQMTINMLRTNIPW